MNEWKSWSEMTEQEKVTSSLARMQRVMGEFDQAIKAGAIADWTTLAEQLNQVASKFEGERMVRTRWDWQPVRGDGKDD